VGNILQEMAALLRRYEKVLGKEHPSTLSSINNLAHVLSDLGKYQEAKQMHQKVLQLRKKVLSKEQRASEHTK
jgi:lipase chaperone LimK